MDSSSRNIRMLCGKAFGQLSCALLCLQEKDKHKKHKSGKKKKRRRQTSSESDSDHTSSDCAAEGKRAKTGEKHSRDSPDREDHEEHAHKKVALDLCCGSTHSP